MPPRNRASFTSDARTIFSLAFSDFKRRYAGSHFGVVWSFVQPVITVLVFWFVFEAGMRTKSVQGVPFLVWLVCGLVPWFYFSEALSGASNCLIEYSYLVKKVVFKVELLPAIKITAATFIHFFFVSLLLVLAVSYGVSPNIFMIQMLYYFMACTALVVALSSVTVPVIPFFKDLSQIVLICLQFGMWLTPIMWDTSLLPEKFRWILFANPVTYVVEGYRDSLLRNQWFWEKPEQTAYFWLLVSFLFIYGRGLFRRLRPHFADVL